MNECQCTVAGYCQRHQVRKSARMVELCQRDADYWQAWEENRGPGQQTAAARREPPPTAEYNHWAPLHYYAVKHRHDWDRVEAYIWYWHEWIENIPKGCGCREKWIELCLEPDFSSPDAFFEWAHAAHDLINRQLGKAVQPTLAEANRIWGFVEAT